jgi:hypothetical protein
VLGGSYTAVVLCWDQNEHSSRIGISVVDYQRGHGIAGVGRRLRSFLRPAMHSPRTGRHAPMTVSPGADRKQEVLRTG